MKTKTIQSVVNSKFDHWAQSITDAKVRKLVKQNTILTGGAIASMLLNEEVNDYDFYFRNKETTKAVAEYYVAKFKENPTSRFAKAAGGSEIPITVMELGDRIKIVVKSAGIANDKGAGEYRYFESVDDTTLASQYVDEVTSVLNADDVAEVATLTKKKGNKADYRPVFLTTNAITLTNDIQVVIRFYGDPQQIHENYDFAHCTNYWSSWDREVHLNPLALECLLAKELRYIGSKYPLASMFRTRKFIQRGWSITAGQMIKIGMQLHDLDLDNVHVLEDQLVGVDIAYFNELICKLKSKCTGDAVDRTYLMTLIDEIF
jgi:hypothetical protein